MTTTLAIITQALRESNLIAITATPSAPEQAEGLQKLNELVASVFGHEVGEELTDWPVGSAALPGLWRSWDAVAWSNPPVNSRLLVSTTLAQTIKLPAAPDNGARMAVVDVANGNINVTLDPGGRAIDAAVVNTADANVTFMYRADLGRWVRLGPLLISDEMPFPTEHDSFFITSLAIKLNPRYGRTIDEQTLLQLKRSLEQLQYDYRRTLATDRRIPQLITRALREAEVINPNARPRNNEFLDGLNKLNQIVDATFGHVVGMELADERVDGAGVVSPMQNTRLLVTTPGNVTVEFPINPDNGARIQIINVGGNGNVVIDGGEYEGDFIPGNNTTWFFRADLGAWLKLTPLFLDDELPFPARYDDYFENALIGRLNPAKATEQSMAVVAATLEKLAQEYRQVPQAESGVRRILVRALRMAELVGKGQYPRPAQLTEALTDLNQLIQSVIGYEMGEGLRDWSPKVGQMTIASNVRVVVEGNDNLTLELPPRPLNGSRVAIAAVEPTPGRTITLAGTRNDFTITDDSEPIEYMYHSGTSRWVRISPVLLTDDMPFPAKYDNFFEMMLSFRLNPRLGRSADESTMALLQRSRSQIQAEFRQKRDMPVASALLRGPRYLNPQTGEPY